MCRIGSWVGSQADPTRMDTEETVGSVVGGARSDSEVRGSPEKETVFDSFGKAY